MEICRACLLTEQDMVPLDEFCVSSYNLLTNLQITLKDEMPQYFCQNCFNMVKVFIDFREKAILSETTLKDITENTKPDTLCTEEKYTVNKIKLEIDCSNDDVLDCEAFDGEVFGTEVEDSCVNELSELNDEVENTLQCGLCTNTFADNTSFMKHLTEHKRGGKCKLCMQKVKISDLYNHALAHKQVTAHPEYVSESPKVKLEIPDDGYFDNCKVGFHEDDISVYQETVKCKSTQKSAVRHLKTSTVKKKNKVMSFKKLKKKSKATILPLLACGLCRLNFDSKDLWLKHVESHKVAGTCSCKLCHENFSSWPQLFAHRVVHLPPKQQHCHLCKRWCNSEIAMEFHYRKMHYDGEDKSVKCKHCLRSFYKSKTLAQHIWGIHREIRYICDYCSKSCHTKQSLIIHIASHSKEKPFVCDLCGFSTKTSRGITCHKLRKHDPRKILCRKCDKIFVDPVKAEQHKCNPISAVCPECGKEFQSNKALHRHLRSHKTEAAYKCNRCSAAYRSGTALKVHLDKHDGNRTKRCEFCGATFYSTSVLIKHRRVHTGEKPYVCKICHKGFTGNYNLKVHMRIHGEDVIVKKDKALQDPFPFSS